MTKGTALKTTIEDGIVSFDGSEGLHAVRDLTLPNTGDNYVVMVGDYEHGFPFTIEAKEYVGWYFMAVFVGVVWSCTIY